jgi:catechol 2,3-dioxygenase-like lactoylglutathione lyase family enzyme
MRRLPNLALRVFFKMVILSLAGLVTFSLGAIFHFRSDTITGIVFLASAFGLFFVIEWCFPSVYSRSGRGAHTLWTKKNFYSGGDVAIDVRDVAAARQWYSDKLGLSYSSTEVGEASMELGYSTDAVVVYLVEVSGNGGPNNKQGRPPIVFARKLADAHEYLSSRSVDVGPIQIDSGGNQFFRFRDLEGNELEVCQKA